MPFKKKYFNDNNDDGRQKHQNADAVDTMHIFHPGAVGGVWVPFLYIQIFCKLPPDTHNLILIVNCKYILQQRGVKNVLLVDRRVTKIRYICRP